MKANENGAIMPLAIIVLSVVLLFFAVIVDGLNMLYYQEKLSNTVMISFSALTNEVDRNESKAQGSIVIDMDKAYESFETELKFHLNEIEIEKFDYRFEDGKVKGEIEVSYVIDLFVLNKFGFDASKVYIKKYFFIAP